MPAEGPARLNEIHLLEVWKTLQENQRSFNDILMKIRPLAVLYAGAVTSAGLAVNWTDGRIVGTFVLLVTIPWLGLYLMDRFYYHVLLQGAVLQAAQIERVLFAGQGLPLPSDSLRDYNHRFPVPGTRIKTGGQKVSTFYATPFVFAAYFGFDSYLTTHFGLGGSPIEWVNLHGADVAHVFSLFMAFILACVFIAVEQDQQRRVKEFLSKNSSRREGAA